jgi:hypothetical protein
MADNIIFDDSEIGPASLAPCWDCVRLEEPFNETCAAFPDGIPREILEGKNSHKDAVKGDNGILFEAKK